MHQNPACSLLLRAAAAGARRRARRAPVAPMQWLSTVTRDRDDQEQAVSSELRVPAGRIPRLGARKGRSSAQQPFPAAPGSHGTRWRHHRGRCRDPPIREGDRTELSLPSSRKRAEGLFPFLAQPLTEPRSNTAHNLCFPFKQGRTFLGNFVGLRFVLLT